MKNYDVVVVGSGFCGAIISRQIAKELNKKVLLVERRNHIAGNMFDYKDEAGILLQKYGPHIFHTNKKDVYEYLTDIWDFEKYHLKCRVVMDGISTPSPFNFQTIDDFYEKNEATELKKRLSSYYSGMKKVTIVEMLKSEDHVIREYAEMLFEKDYKLYTSKQWGISPDEIDISVLSRVPVILSYEDGYFDDLFQVMPKGGFTSLFDRILDEENIDIMLETDAMDFLELDKTNSQIYFKGCKKSVPVIYTGEIDRLFNYEYGELPYRSLRFEYKTYDIDSFQDAAVTAYPQAEDYTRITEFKKLPHQNVAGKTTVAYEYPLKYKKNAKLEPYYPILTEDNTLLYNKYYELATKFDNLFLCGRLADYKYYNMDDAISRALSVYEIIKISILKSGEL